MVQINFISVEYKAMKINIYILYGHLRCMNIELFGKNAWFKYIIIFDSLQCKYFSRLLLFLVIVNFN